MARNLKALGLFLAAVVAFGAAMASTASAAYITSDGPVTLKVTATGDPGKGLNAITAFGGTTECEFEGYGHKYNVTPHEMLEATSTIATFTMKTENCITKDSLGNEFSTKVDPNGCDLVMHPGETTETGGIKVYGVITTIECVNLKEHYQLTLFDKFGIKVCTFTLTAPAEGVEGPHLRNTPFGGSTPTDFIDLNGTFNGLTVHKSGTCGMGESAASMDVDARIKGYTSAGESTGITISD